MHQHFTMQLRLLDGTSAVKSYKVTDTLQDVVNELGSDNTRLMTNFPKRFFTDEDLGRTLHDLGMYWKLRLLIPFPLVYYQDWCHQLYSFKH